MEKNINNFPSKDENNTDNAKLVGNIKIDHILNRDSGELPYAYYNPETEGKLIWLCAINEHKKIESVFEFMSGEHLQSDRCVKELETMEDAKFMRDELIKNGWKIYVPPKIEITMPDGKPMNRKQKRILAKEIKKKGLISGF